MRERPCGFSWMADVIPPGASGAVTIDHFDITDKTFQGWGGDWTNPGRYARLLVNGAVVMSDTDMEIRSNFGAVMDARGDVLVGGLGLGMVVLPMIRKPEVRSVTVVEINEDVMNLVGSALLRHLSDGEDWIKLAFVLGDVEKWRPSTGGRIFDYIYFDIWSNICLDNLDEMKKLHLAFRRYLRTGGKVTSWQHDRLKWLRSQGRWR